MSRKKKADEPAPEPLHRVDHGELKKLAVALFSNQLFTSSHIEKGQEHLASSIFMPLLFLDNDGREQLAAKKPHVFYEFMSEAGPRAINGYPIFMSVKMLVKEDWDLVKEMAAKMGEAAEAL